MLGLAVALVLIPSGPASAIDKVDASYSFHPERPAVGQPVQFTDTSTTGEGTIVDWAWDFDDGEVSNQQNPTHVFTEAGRYSVKLTVTNSKEPIGESAHEIHDIHVDATVEEP